MTIVVVAFWFCKAILRRFARLAFWDNWEDEVVVLVVIYAIVNTYFFLLAGRDSTRKTYLGLVFTTITGIILIVD